MRDSVFRREERRTEARARRHQRLTEADVAARTIAHQRRERVGAAVALELHVERAEPALAGRESAGMVIHDDLGLDRIVAVEQAAPAIAAGGNLELPVHVALIAGLDEVVAVAGLEV